MNPSADEANASAEDVVKRFYDTKGWVKDGDKSAEDIMFRDFPKAYYAHAERCSEWALQPLREKTGSLLIAGCGDMPDAQVELASHYSAVTCIDISSTALDVAATKLKPNTTYVNESLLSSSIASDQFDAIQCSHVIYHIDKDLQEQAVSEIIRMLKPGGKAVIIYANPWSPFAIPGEFMWLLTRAIKPGAKLRRGLYYHAKPLSWWNRFTSKAKVTIRSNDVIGSRPARALLKSEGMANAFFKSVMAIETRFPKLAVRLWQYCTVVLEKR